jgi:hypothetical protein
MRLLTAHNQINLHTGARRAVQRLNDRRIDHRINLGDDPHRTSAPRMARLSIDPMQCTISPCRAKPG